MSDESITTVKDPAANLLYNVCDMVSALWLAEQLRLIRGGLTGSDPMLAAKEKRPYSDDIAAVARKIKADMPIPTTVKGSPARA